MLASPMELVVVDRTRSRPVCEEHALVLQSVGVGFQIAWDGEAWLLLVDEADAGTARTQLARYVRENPPRAHAPAERLNSDAWAGSAAYVGVLVAIGWLAGHETFDLDWWDA